MSGGGTQTTTEQSQTSYPQWTQDAQQNTYQTGGSMLENFLRNPQYAVAGMNTDQMKGLDLARDTARTAYTAPQINVPGSPNLNASMSSAAQVTPGAINEFNQHALKHGRFTAEAIEMRRMHSALVRQMRDTAEMLA